MLRFAFGLEPGSGEIRVSATLKRAIVVEFFSCFAMQHTSAGSLDAMAKNADQFADYLIENHESQAVEIAKLVAYGGSTFLRARATDFEAWCKLPLAILEKFPVDLVGQSIGTATIVGAEDAKKAESSAKAEKRKRTSPLNRVKEDKPAPVAKAVEPPEVEVPKKPAEVGIKALGLSPELTELLLDNGLGTSKMLLQFDLSTAKGLKKIVKTDGDREQILKAIAEKTSETVVV